MKTVYFVRHGEGENNTTGKYFGEHAPLTPKGIEQAELVAKRLASHNIDTILSSTMTRARETASIIGKEVGLPVHESPVFNERAQPAWLVGLSKDDAKRQAWDAWCREHIADDSWDEPDAENYHTLITRAHEALLFLTSREGKRIVCVTHGTFLRYITGTIMFGEHMTPHVLMRFRDASVTHNTGLTICSQDDEVGWKLITWNDHAHLMHVDS